jgi:hypothetical protein
MENQPVQSSAKTPSKTNWGLWIRLLAGASLILFIAFFIVELVSVLTSSKFEGSSLIPLFALFIPMAFGIVLLIKGERTRKGAAFGFDVTGIVLWLLTVVILFLAVALAGIFTAIFTCPATSSSSSSVGSSLASSSGSTSSGSSSSGCTSWVNNFLNPYVPLSLIFILVSIVHEVFLGISAFGKKKLPILLYIFTGIVFLVGLGLGLFLSLNLGTNRFDYLLPFFGTDFLLVAFDFVILYGTNEKVSPHPEDTLEQH